MNAVNAKIKEIHSTHPEMPWDKVATVINYSFGTDLTGNACRKRYKRANGGSASVMPSLEKSRYRWNVPLNMEPNLLIIPDLHAPFIAGGFIDFLLRVKKRFNLKNVISIGDIVDQCAISFYDGDPDGLSAGSELELTKDALQELGDHFPEMKITIGNHDNRHLRLAKKAGLPEAYIKDFLEIFDVPDTWEWHHSFILNEDTLLEHGTYSGKNATYDRALTTSMNVIQGHTHNYAGVTYINDGIKTRWGMNVGCGIDYEAYAFHYATARKSQPTLTCGVLLDGVPLVIPFEG